MFAFSVLFRQAKRNFCAIFIFLLHNFWSGQAAVKFYTNTVYFYFASKSVFLGFCRRKQKRITIHSNKYRNGLDIELASQSSNILKSATI